VVDVNCEHIYHGLWWIVVDPSISRLRNAFLVKYSLEVKKYSSAMKTDHGNRLIFSCSNTIYKFEVYGFLPFTIHSLCMYVSIK
jgi:hypothetical protein